MRASRQSKAAPYVLLLAIDFLHGIPRSCSAHPFVLFLEASGHSEMADLLGVVDMAATIVHREGHARALVNLLEVENELTFTDHMQLGTYAAEKLRHLERLASVVPSTKRTGTSEKAANKSGLTLRVFTGLAEALEWIAADVSEARQPRPSPQERTDA